MVNSKVLEEGWAVVPGGAVLHYFEKGSEIAVCGKGPRTTPIFEINQRGALADRRCYFCTNQKKTA